LSLRAALPVSRRGSVAALCAGIGALAAAGCGGSLFQSKVPPITVFMLAAAPGAGGATVAPLDAELAVLKPRVRTGLNTDRIAAYYPDRHLDYFAGASWSGPVDEVVQDLAVQVFHSAANLHNVSSAGSSFIEGYWLELEVEDFQAEYAPGGGVPIIAVRVRGRVGGTSDRRVLGQFEAVARRPAADNRLGAIVEAYNQAANAALVEIAGDTTAALSAGR
jgi:cholesterol transport system auxiliary component